MNWVYDIEIDKFNTGNWQIMKTFDDYNDAIKYYKMLKEEVIAYKKTRYLLIEREKVEKENEIEKEFKEIITIEELEN